MTISPFVDSMSFMLLYSLVTWLLAFCGGAVGSGTSAPFRYGKGYMYSAVTRMMKVARFYSDESMFATRRKH